MIPTTFVAVVLAVMVAKAAASSSGPPITYNANLCTNMFPQGHDGAAAQVDDPPPVTVKVNTCYKENMELEVEVKHSSENLKGIFVQARVGTEMLLTNDTTDPVGTFKSAGDSQPMKAYKCKANNDAWGHSAKLSSKEVEFYWVAPSADAGVIRIVVTAVQNKTIFWTFVQSKPIRFDSKCESTASITSLNLGLLALTLLVALGSH